MPTHLAATANFSGNKLTSKKVKISFTVPEHIEIKPQDKFAILFLVLQQQHKETLLEQWNAEATVQAQSIISGADLLHDKEQLSIYCPHVQRNACLDTLWRLQSTA
eukprot:13151601-Ditylum_brightwellii.AAC.1